MPRYIYRQKGGVTAAFIFALMEIKNILIWIAAGAALLVAIANNRAGTVAIISGTKISARRAGQPGTNK